jgi:hypothetical protein
MDNNFADRSDILPSLTTLFNIVAARFSSFADKDASGNSAYFLAQHPRVIVASLPFKE